MALSIIFVVSGLLLAEGGAAQEREDSTVLLQASIDTLSAHDTNTAHDIKSSPSMWLQDLQHNVKTFRKQRKLKTKERAAAKRAKLWTTAKAGELAISELSRMPTMNTNLMDLTGTISTKQAMRYFLTALGSNATITYLQLATKTMAEKLKIKNNDFEEACDTFVTKIREVHDEETILAALRWGFGAMANATWMTLISIHETKMPLMKALADFPIIDETMSGHEHQCYEWINGPIMRGLVTYFPLRSTYPGTPVCTNLTASLTEMQGRRDNYAAVLTEMEKAKEDLPYLIENMVDSEDIQRIADVALGAVEAFTTLYTNLKEQDAFCMSKIGPMAKDILGCELKDLKF